MFIYLEGWWLGIRGTESRETIRCLALAKSRILNLVINVNITTSRYQGIHPTTPPTKALHTSHSQSTMESERP